MKISLKIVHPLAFCLFYSSIVAAQGALHKVLYTYSLKTHTIVKDSTSPAPYCGDIAVLYKGVLELFSGTTVCIQEPACVCTFSLIITEYVRTVALSSSQGLQHLAIDADQPHKWFDLTLMLKNGTWSWHIEKRVCTNQCIVLPDHAIVVLYPPHLVTKLIPPYQAAYGTELPRDYLNGFTFEFPTLLITGTAQELEEANLTMSAQLPYIKKYHATVAKTKRICDGCLLICDATQ